MQRNMKDNKTKRHDGTSFIATNHYPDSNVTADNIRPYVYPGCNTCQPDEDIMSDSVLLQTVILAMMC